MNVDYHRILLDNATRLDAYVAAIEASVHEDCVVVDAGAGTGLLSMIAARAGARRVYAVEQHAVLQIARDNVARNALGDRIVCMQADAGTVELPEPVDLIISDLIGVFGVDLDILRVYEHLTKTCLRPGGRVIPERIDVFFCPWEAPELHASVSFWNDPIAGFDLSSMRRLAVNRPLSVLVPPTGAVAQAEHYWTLDLHRPVGKTSVATRTHEITRDATIHGIASWFRAELCPEVILHSTPDKTPIPWRQGFLPLETPLVVSPGNRLELRLTGTQEASRVLLGWSGELHPADGSSPTRSFAHHQFLAELDPIPA